MRNNTLWTKTRPLIDIKHGVVNIDDGIERLWSTMAASGITVFPLKAINIYHHRMKQTALLE